MMPRDASLSGSYTSDQYCFLLPVAHSLLSTFRQLLQKKLWRKNAGLENFNRAFLQIFKIEEIIMDYKLGKHLTI